MDEPRELQSRDSSTSRCAIEKLDKYFSKISLMGRLSNTIVVLSLYDNEQHSTRVKLYASRFLREAKKETTSEVIKNLSKEYGIFQLPPDFDHRMPRAIEVIEEISHGVKPDKASVEEAKDFLSSIENGLSLLVEEQEGASFEPWYPCIER
jgi:sugar-specific transcriptional regulator TrmB